MKNEYKNRELPVFDILNLETGKLGVVIRCGRLKKSAGKNTRRLFGAWIVPVCSLVLLAGAGIGGQQDLNRFALLHFEDHQGRVSWISLDK